MDTKERYKLADAQRQKRLSEMSADFLDLRPEIAVARLLLSDSLEDRNPNLSNAMLQTLTKLTSAQLTTSIRARQVISIEDLRVFAQRISESIVRHLAHVPGHEDIVEAIAADFAAGLCDLSKPVLRIGGTPNAQ